MLRKLALFLAVSALVAGLGWRFATHWAPSRDAYPTQGVGVSRLQGEIDWNAARAAGVDFAYVKASEGGNQRDDRFAVNWPQTAAAGVKRGAYHVFTLCAPGRDQATNFIALVPREADALPPAVDLKFGEDCAARPPRDAVLAEIAAFIKMVEAHSEKPVMLHVSREFDDFYRVSEAIDRPLWLKRAGFAPDYGGRPWVMWQANPRRRVEGISEAVGWNVVRAQ